MEVQEQWKGEILDFQMAFKIFAFLSHIKEKISYLLMSEYRF